jgi:hypothetical protein
MSLALGRARPTTPAAIGGGETTHLDVKLPGEDDDPDSPNFLCGL